MQSTDFKWKNLLNKINLITESMDSTQGVSLLERDLLLHYLRQFYEATSELQLSEQPVSSPKQEKSTPVKVMESPKIEPPKIEVKPPVVEPIELPISRQETRQQIEEIVEKKEPKEVPVEIVVKEEPVIVQTPEPISEPKEIPQTSFKEEVSLNIDHEIRNHPIFEGVDKNEIGLRFSEMPIADLRKAMGFNEKLTSKKLLFVDNESLMEETLEKLNNFSNFEEAKSTLVKLAHRYDWLSETKEKAAKAFVKLVYRRYKS